MSGNVVTRFPPSPTGFLHIGGARTALFNWLYAKANNGRMVLRIEDTDRERSTQEAVDAILDGLEWLGLDWDGEPVSQAGRAARHVEIARRLQAKGLAYNCYCSPEELQAMRDRAREQGRPMRYDGTWRDRAQSEAPAGIKPVLRFRARQQGQTIVHDKVMGDVTYENSQLDDLILLRSDGSPTYNLSVVCDDHDMGITHIIRGVDHLTNAARQIQIYQALGWQVPVMAHIPLIHGPDGAKLSKRHGALGVEAYREMGYLPQAMRNYLARLGWSHGDDEIFSTEQAIEWFDFDAIGKSPARFDFAKLENLNGHYMRHMDIDELFSQFISTLPYLPDGKAFLDKLTDKNMARLKQGFAGLRERAKNLVELMNSAGFLVAGRPLPVEEKAARILENGGREILAEILPVLTSHEDWSHDSLHAAVRSFSEQAGVKLGKIAQPLRAALTGSTVSPGIFDVMQVLGREESLARIKDACKRQ